MSKNKDKTIKALKFTVNLSYSAVEVILLYMYVPHSIKTFNVLFVSECQGSLWSSKQIFYTQIFCWLQLII